MRNTLRLARYSASLMALLIALLAPAAARGEITLPDDKDTYVIAIDSPAGQQRLYIYWNSELEGSSAQPVRVELDTPWEPGRYEWVKPNQITEGPIRETRTARKKRLEEQLASAGLTQVRPGYYIAATEAELARKARAAAGISSEQDQDAAPAVKIVEAQRQPAPAPSSSAQPQAVNPLARWGAHLLLAAVMVALIILISRVTMAQSTR